MLLGVPYWPFFALLAFILEVIPTFGVLLAATGPALLLLADHPDRLIWLAIGLVIVHQLEDRLIIPHVMGKASDLPQAMVAFAILAFGLIWGPAGVIMAVPVSATLMAVFIEWRTGSVPSPNRDPTPDPPALASVDDPIPAVSTSEDPSS
jgi:predicted PurR-regulated permease PerM